MQDMNWNDLRYILSLARNGTLSAAAEALRVDETTVARRIARLERQLGSKLFHRVSGTMRPSDSGAMVLEHAERIELEIGQLSGRASGADRSAKGTVRLTAIPLLINRILIPSLGDLQRQHDGLRLELVAEPRNLSFTRREADMALRFSRPDKETDVVSRRLTTLDYAVYARSTAEAQKGWVTYDEGMAALPHVAWINKCVRQEGTPPSLVVNDSEVALAALKQRAGKSLLPCIVADNEPELVRLSSAVPVLSRELWVLIHPEHRDFARIRAVLDWLNRIFAQHQRRS
jgi:DNA-binding transcriptional LysR family regulator